MDHDGPRSVPPLLGYFFFPFELRPSCNRLVEFQDSQSASPQTGRVSRATFHILINVSTHGLETKMTFYRCS